MTQKTHGIDISKWQGTIDWEALEAAHKAGQVDFIIMRAGYGYATIDPLLEGYYREATARGIPCGAYWYSYWSKGTPAQEAGAFLAAVSGKNLQYGLWLDVEYEKSITSLDKTTRTSMTLEGLATLATSGRYVGLYASTDMINNRMEYSRLSAYDIWVAQYASKCTCKMPYGIWQYTSSGSTAGISGRVDQDRAYKDYPAIVVGNLASGGAATIPDTPGEPTPPRVTTTIQTSLMTRGDLKTVLEKAVELGLYVTGELIVGPMTEGDTATMTGLLDGLGIEHEEV